MLTLNTPNSHLIQAHAIARLSRNTLARLVTAVICVALLSGCASHYGAATIITQPAGAEILDAENDSVIGVTPFTTFWKDSSSSRRYVALKLRKQGYEPEVSHFWLNMRHSSKSSAIKAPKKVTVVLKEKQ